MAIQLIKVEYFSEVSVNFTVKIGLKTVSRYGADLNNLELFKFYMLYIKNCNSETHICKNILLFGSKKT